MLGVGESEALVSLKLFSERDAIEQRIKEMARAFMFFQGKEQVQRQADGSGKMSSQKAFLIKSTDMSTY